MARTCSQDGPTWASRTSPHWARRSSRCSCDPSTKAPTRRSSRRSARRISSTSPAVTRTTCPASCGNSPLGDAVRAAAARGAVIAGCSAGAMAITTRTMAPRRAGQAAGAGALAAALGGRTRPRAGHHGDPALQLDPGDAVGIPRAPGAAPDHASSGSTTTPRRSGATGSGRCTAPAGSPSGAAVIASASGPVTPSGSDTSRGATARTGMVPVTANLSQWGSRLGTARRERWGRPVRVRVLRVTGRRHPDPAPPHGRPAGRPGCGRSRDPVVVVPGRRLGAGRWQRRAREQGGCAPDAPDPAPGRRPARGAPPRPR